MVDARRQESHHSLVKKSDYEGLVAGALKEDIGSGDATTQALVPPAARTRAVIVARHPVVMCGLAVAREVFRQVNPRIRVLPAVKDGDRVEAGGRVMLLSGPADAILTAERTALNFLQRLSGIATLTREFVRRAGPKTRGAQAHGARIP